MLPAAYKLLCEREDRREGELRINGDWRDDQLAGGFKGTSRRVEWRDKKRSPFAEVRKP